MSLFKNTRMREKLQLQFRAEAFNTFNRVQFGVPQHHFYLQRVWRRQQPGELAEEPSVRAQASVLARKGRQSLALLGLRVARSDKSVIAAPKARAANFSSFWSTATGWGVVSQSNQGARTRFSLSVIAGNLPCRSVELVGEAVGDAKSSASLGQKSLVHQMRAAQKRLTFVFPDSLDLGEGDRLVLGV